MAKLSIRNETQAKYHACTFAVSGPISGRGGVEVMNYHTNVVAILNPANSYTGGTYINNNQYAMASTLLGYPGSIPNADFTAVTSRYGFVDLAIDGSGERWSYDAAMRFARDATFQNSCRLRFSDIFATERPVTLAFSLAEGTVPGTIFLGAKDSVRFEGAGNETPIPFRWDGGSAVFSGAGAVLFDDVCIKCTSSASATNTVVTFDGADATLYITNTFYIGQSGSKFAKVVVKDSVLRNSDVMKNDFYTGYDNPDWGGPTRGGAIFAGYASPGILEVLDGAVISNRVIVCGFGPNSANSGSGQGAVFKRGGKVVALGASVVHHTSCVGLCQEKSTSGYYELEDGLLEARGAFVVGGYGYGCFAQYGGHVLVSNRLASAATKKERGLSLSTCNQGRGVLYIKKGSWDLFVSDLLLGEGSTANPTAEITLDGPEATFDAHDAIFYAALRGHNGIYTVNLNGGELRCGGFRLHPYIVNNNLTNNKFCVNFNGGTLKAGASHSGASGISLFGDMTASATSMTNVVVYVGGATIDTDGQIGNHVDVPLNGAFGKGVKSIALGEPIKGTEYISSPRVTITGDGIGATAFAHFDSTNMVVDRIVVTSPGCGYTTATASIYYGQNLYRTITSEDGCVVLEENENVGAFTKKGEGILTLNATNTWGGATVVDGGTLKAGCDWAVPTNSAVSLGSGGVLDLNGKAARISSVEYLPGGGSIVNASAAELPGSFSLRTSIDDIVAGRPIMLSGSHDLSGVALTVEGNDYSALDKRTRRYRVLSVTGGTITGKPEIAAEPPPRPWAYTVRPDGVMLGYATGTVFTVR